MKRILLAASGLSLLLAACDKPADFSCASDDAKSVISSIVTDQVIKATKEAVGDSAAETQTTEAKIRATIAQLKFLIEDVRTAKEDPNSTKKFCQGTLKVVMPLGMIADADKARTAVDLSTASAMLVEAGYERSADSFTKEITYTVQPTDDKKKVYGEVEAVSLLDPLGELVASHLMLTHIQAQMQGLAAGAAAMEQQTAAQAQADQDLARAENKLADQSLNEIWKTLPEGARAPRLEMQRAWINKKTADCNIEAAGESTDPIARESARLRCDTRLTQARSEELRELLTSY